MPRNTTSQPALHCVPSAGEPVHFELRRSRRKTLAIHVQADGRVVVRSPQWVSRWEIDALLIRKQDWILRKQAEFSERQKTHEARRQAMQHRRFYLGKTYALELSQGDRTRIELDGDLMRIRARDTGQAAINEVLNRWYGQRAREVLPERLEPCLERVRDFGLPSPELRFRKMRARWGSCTHRGRITLNTELVKAGEDCIDYVLVHELCHLRELNHGPRFYALMDAAMPDWRARKRDLESVSLMF